MLCGQLWTSEADIRGGGGAKIRLSYTECAGERLTNANDRDDFSRADPRASRAVLVAE